jgi:hypothetical protein
MKKKEMIRNWQFSGPGRIIATPEDRMDHFL